MKVHTIADLRQSETGTSWTLCICGWRCEGARPETTEELYLAHRREMKAPTRNMTDNLGLAGSRYYGRRVSEGPA